MSPSDRASELRAEIRAVIDEAVLAEAVSDEVALDDAASDEAAIAEVAIAEAASDEAASDEPTPPAPPANTAELAEVLRALREVSAADRRTALRRKLRIAGLVDHPNGDEQQRCMECMYFVVHRRWCELPELSLPVEPEWWCRLWRA